MRHKATVRKVGNVWRLDTMVDGVRHREALGEGTERWAQAEGDKTLERRLNGGIHVPAVVTAGVLVEAWELFGLSGQARNGRLKPRTIRGCASAFLGLGQVAGLTRESPLRAWTPTLVRAWHEARLKALGDLDEEEEAAALYSAYSTWNQARSLFGSRALTYYEDRKIPGVREWAAAMKAVDLPTGEIRPYELPPLVLRERTEKEGNALRGVRDDLWIVYKLAINCGLRAGEIVAMERDWVELCGGGLAVSVCRRGSFRPKGRGRRVPIDAGLWADILALMGDRQTVLPGSPTARENLIAYEFSAWMRGIGWEREQYAKAAHELRKLYGSRVYSKLGAAAAQEYLGHASMTTTCKYYARLDCPMQLLDVR